MLVMTLVLTVFHWCDAISAIVADEVYDTLETEPSFYVTVFMFFEAPGVLTSLLMGYCFVPGTCNSNSNTLSYVTAGVFIVIGFVLPPIIAMICMILQIVTLHRKDRQVSNRNGSLSGPPDFSHHVSLTVLFVSILFFCCHTIYLISLVVWFALFGSLRGEDSMFSYKIQGTFVGLFVVILPLVNAVLHPVILISRKKELRQRYKQFFEAVFYRGLCIRDSDRSVEDIGQ